MADSPAAGPAGPADDDPLPAASVLRVLVACDDSAGAEHGWAARLPVVPDGRTVTATLTAVELLRDLPQLEDRGYVFAGVHSSTLLPPGLAAVDLLVPDALARGEPGWYRALAGCAHRAFPLVFGPARRLFGKLARVHLAVPEHAGR